MPTYVAFLRAINLGARRKFPKDAITSATEAAGGTDVETYINTGNVRLTHSARSVAKVRAALEEAYAAAERDGRFVRQVSARGAASAKPCAIR